MSTGGCWGDGTLVVDCDGVSWLWACDAGAEFLVRLVPLRQFAGGAVQVVEDFVDCRLRDVFVDVLR